MNQKVLAVQKMQEYIETHLEQEITLAQLSKVSLFSPWYSYRIFKEYTGLTIADYIRKLRLSESALKLRDSKCKIADIAFAMGFQSVDGYQRAFQREFLCNPKEFANHPIPVYLFHPYGVKFQNMEVKKNMSEQKNVFVQVIEKPARKVVIKRGVKATDYFEYCNEVGCDVWGLLKSIKSLDGEPVCLWLTPTYIEDGTSSYVQGVEVGLEYSDAIPEGFDVIEIPTTTYLMFQGEPFEEEDFCIAIEQVQEAIQKYNPTAIGYEWDKTSPRIQLEPIGTRGYIELHPIKKVKMTK